jgi:hypothetical protein
LRRKLPGFSTSSILILMVAYRIFILFLQRIAASESTAALQISSVAAYFTSFRRLRPASLQPIS